MKKNWLVIVLVILMGLMIGCSSQSEELEQAPSQSSSSSQELDPPTDSAAAGEVSAGAESTFEGYEQIEVDGGDMSGHREANVVVDIGFGDREYWAFTNEYGQLVRVVAKEIILQDDSTEPVTSDGRYYNDEARVPGTELDNYDQGHIIADSLGGVSNAYNITPQENTLNRYGDQAYMERNIRNAGGCTDFEAIITYPDNKTQIPSHYHYTYTLMGNVITEDFDNVNPDEANQELIDGQKAEDAAPAPASTPAPAVEPLPAPAQNQEVIVYVTDTGTKYHNAGCSYLKSSNPMSLSDAKSAGYTPCSRCHPPQ